MKKSFVLLLAFAFVCIVFAEEEQEKCTRKDSWSDGCNTCFCTNDGRVACTRKLCEPVAVPVKEGEKKIEDNTESCSTPGESFTRDCNKCYCTDAKKIACTRKLCDEKKL